MMLKKVAFYIFAVLFIFAGQFLVSSGLVTGKPPKFENPTIDGHPPMQALARGPALLYFWAEWCGVCRGMRDNVEAVLHDYPGLTVAERSGDPQHILDYLSDNKLNWPVVSDNDGSIGHAYGVKAVPAVFFINSQGNIVFTTVGYTSESGLRFRLWLTSFL